MRGGGQRGGGEGKLAHRPFNSTPNMGSRNEYTFDEGGSASTVGPVGIPAGESGSRSPGSVGEKSIGRLTWFEYTFFHRGTPLFCTPFTDKCTCWEVRRRNATPLSVSFARSLFCGNRMKLAYTIFRGLHSKLMMPVVLLTQ